MSESVAMTKTSLGKRLDTPHGFFGDLAVIVFIVVQCLDGGEAWRA